MNRKQYIIQPTPQDLDELLEVWESAVRSTHHFLTEKDILFYKRQVPQYLSAVELYSIRNGEGKIAAFMGLSNEQIEMLFVRHEEKGKGYGKQLLKYAIQEKQIRKIDVNEQNEQALLFYKHQGFNVTGRNETDPSGKPFPILHMQCTYTPEIQTGRLLLRSFKESDLQDFFECCHNPNLGNNAGWKPHDTLEESEIFLRTIFLSQENLWAIVSNKSKHVIGSVGIIPDNKREKPRARMLGYWLKEEEWGKGIMTEAVEAVLQYGFKQLKLDLITANCYPFNKRSQHILERQGFTYEGTLHQAEHIYTGEVYDHLCYYLTSAIYDSRQQ